MGTGLADYFVSLEKSTDEDVSATCDALADAVSTKADARQALVALEAVAEGPQEEEEEEQQPAAGRTYGEADETRKLYEMLE